jgi:hypothetical protein
MAEILLSDRPLARLALDVSSRIETLGAANCHALIACSKTKSTHRDVARHMYASPLYRKSVLAAESWGMLFSILSAKHGLLSVDELIEPYDVTLKGASKPFKNEWAARVNAQLHTIFDKGKSLIILAGDDYYQPLLDAGAFEGLDHFAPMRGLSLGHRLAFLNQCIRLKKRKENVAHAYGLFESLSSHIGMRELRSLLDTELPKQGVYFFFDVNEASTFSRKVPRLVRIGTHGVSAGSIATLRTRLRTHLGTRSGLGNHRASVFRLHVGRAIIEREGLHDSFPNWGKGQSAPKEITAQESQLEHRVSEYIGQLHVLYVPVADTAGTGSMRAMIERQFIALFTEHISPVERATSSWLGRFSDKATIRETGLWNVRDVGGECDLKFVRFFEGVLAKAMKG